MLVISRRCHGGRTDVGCFAQPNCSSRLVPLAPIAVKMPLVLAAPVALMFLTFRGVPSLRPVEWFVVLELAADENAALIDRGTAASIRRALEGAMTGALHSPDRFAIQLRVMESSIERAFTAALQRWRESAQSLLPREWHVVRAEILTAAEFEREVECEQ